MSIEVKDSSVNLWGLRPEMHPVLVSAAAIWSQHGETLVVTSARDGIHSAGSMHYYGLAVDLRTRYFSDAVKSKVADLLRGRLATYSDLYDVIVHDTHIHVEWDWPRSKASYR